MRKIQEDADAYDEYLPGGCRDSHYGFQLYQSDPSGNYGGWKATAIGANNQAAQSILRQDYKEDITLDEALKLVMKVSPFIATPGRLAPSPEPQTQLSVVHALC